MVTIPNLDIYSYQTKPRYIYIHSYHNKPRNMVAIPNLDLYSYQTKPTDAIRKM